MSRFSETWLDLREPLDAASRSSRLLETLLSLRPDRPLHVTDLATGTGANLRYMSPRLGGMQHWCLVDHDADLLAQIPTRMTAWAAGGGVQAGRAGPTLDLRGPGFSARASCLRQDLVADLPGLDLATGGLVTASALLDLTSASWLEGLAARCRASASAVLFALTYDGRLRFQPREPEDERVRTLLNRHQMTDKGFGAALGPRAGARAVEIFEAEGYRVVQAPSDWQLEPRHRELQDRLLEGWLEAALEMAPDEASSLRGWLERRRLHIEAGRSELTVGHVDLLGWYPG